MKILLTIVAVFAFAGTSYAGDILKVRSKDYTCEDLQDLVQEEGTVHIKWIGSLDVHSSTSACDGRVHGREQEAYQSSWRTIDKKFCLAGYSCRVDLSDDDN